jgi:ABC-type branched-subunit amino acid transport system permease subunit
MVFVISDLLVFVIVIVLIITTTTTASFIMITLSFAQMGYFVVISLKQYGGDDGMSIATASDFGLWKLSSPQSVYYMAWVLLALLTVWIWRLRVSSFGMILRAGRQNARRVASIGVPLRRYQLTAYALSASGPILHPGIAGWVLVPIASHTLSNRPIVLPDTGVIRITVVAGRDASANFDMQALASLLHGDQVRVRRSAHKVRFLHPRGWSYYATLRRKLRWYEGVV